MALLYFFTSVSILGVAILRPKIKTGWRYYGLIIACLIYFAFCFVSFARTTGLIQGETLIDLINQSGYNSRQLPIDLRLVIDAAFVGASLFNIFTLVWIWFRGNFWKWIISTVILFCVIASVAGLVTGISPILTLFGACCGFMAAVGWVLGLSYIQICVIGNIWAPAFLIMLSACYLIYSAATSIKATKSTLCFVAAIPAAAFAALQIIASLWVLNHYAGTFRDAFDLCVSDLLYIGSLVGNSYEIVNIYIYVLGIPLLITLDILWSKFMFSSKFTLSERAV